jgi:hypothetical protein
VTPTTQRRSNLSLALRHARKGRKVIPLHGIRPGGGCTCRLGKKCGTNAGKHPRIKTGNDHLDAATTDPDQIRKWWTKWPDANVGWVTGAASGQIVVDVDDPAARAQMDGALPDTQTVRSHGDHVHLIYACDDPDIRLDSEGRIAPGIHARANGGYVVGAGSTHWSGERYRVIDRRKPVKAPDSLLKLLRRNYSSNGSEAVRSDVRAVDSGPSGESGSRDDRDKAVIVAMRLAEASTADIRSVVRKLAERAYADEPNCAERVADELRMVNESEHWNLAYEQRNARFKSDQRLKDEARIELARERAAPPCYESERMKILRAVRNGPLNKTALRDEVEIDKNKIDARIRSLVKDGALERRYADDTPVDESAPKSGVAIMHHITDSGSAEVDLAC